MKTLDTTFGLRFSVCGTAALALTAMIGWGFASTTSVAVSREFALAPVVASATFTAPSHPSTVVDQARAV